MTDIDILPWGEPERFAPACWGFLMRGAADARHDFHRPVLATGTSEMAAARMVVLREALSSPPGLEIHTDSRAEKVNQVEQQPLSSLLFWWSRHKLQIRARGSAQLHFDDEIADKAWEKLSVGSRKNYAASLTPGTQVASVEEMDAAYQSTESATEADSEAWRSNFCVLRLKLRSLDVLQLRGDGHRRAICTWKGPRWEVEWVVP